jgi:uncharacterized protein (DUF983 family)
MYNILISTSVALLLFLLLTLATGLTWWLSLLISLPVMMGCFYLISRLVMKRVMAIMETASRDLQGQRVEKAVRELQSAFRYG